MNRHHHLGENSCIPTLFILECGDRSPLSYTGTRPGDQSADTSAHSEKGGEMNWPHAPKHWLFEPGTYMVTTGTYQKKPHLNTPERRDPFLTPFYQRRRIRLVSSSLGSTSNHYHFIACSPADPGTLQRLLGKLHMTTSKHLNDLDGQPGRKVSFQFWDSHITFERSYLARLNYVHHNPVHHGIVDNAENYQWCSAAWFGRNAPAGFVKTVNSFKTDQLKIPDDF